MEREYIVTLHEGVDWEQFNEEMIALTGDGAIPQRSVDVVKLRPNNTRNTHYSLTEEEVQILKSDGRVLAVAVPIEQNPNLKIVLNATSTISQDGHQRHSTTTYQTITDYNYTLDGSGVDIIIQDTGVDTTHSEFSGRIVSGGWAYGNHTTDSDGHGTHVAGIAAGSTYGWAKGASIIPQKINISGISDGMSTADALDAITTWHNAKANDRPTIVNMSWGLTAIWDKSTVDNALATTGVPVYYRGSAYTATSLAQLQGYGAGINYDSNYYYVTYRDASIDADLQQMINAGIHVIIASGNDSTKIDINTGNDYNNYVTSGSNYYYHRGSSPHDDGAINIGSIDFNVTNDRSDFSNYGPAVDIYACGNSIVSANTGGGSVSLSGTSMASPQVCGLAALYLQAHPDYTPAQLKNKLINSSVQGQIPSSADNDYTNTSSILNGNNRILYNRYNSQYPLTVVHIS